MWELYPTSGLIVCKIECMADNTQNYGSHQPSQLDLGFDDAEIQIATKDHKAQEIQIWYPESWIEI
jgi:hypothetical protein